MQIRLLAVATGALMLGTACGDGGGTPPSDNRAPVAGFSEACTLLSCVFTDASTDPDGATDIASRSWDFGDGSPLNTTDVSPTHDYAAEGTKHVALTVKDKAGASNVFSKDVVVSAAANNLPVADFTPNCSGLGCSFTDASSDPDGNATIVAWSWTFGDAGVSSVRNPDHEYLVAGTYDVGLEVTDNRGGKASQTKQVVVTSGPAGNVAPTAEFFPACIGFNCTFDDQSTDVAPGTIVGWSWNFNDGSAISTEQSPSHTFAAGSHNVVLTVTDDGGATASKSETVTISAPVTATLTLPARSRLVFTLAERGCTSPRNAFMITAPVADTLFKDGCRVPDATQLPFVYPSKGPFTGDVTVQFVSGSTHQELSPKVTVTGGYPDWRLSFDDGEDSPADMDLVVTVHANAAP